MYYQHVLDGVVTLTKRCFREQLTGIYLHGSLAMGCFQPEKSDIDLLVVIGNELSDAQKLDYY